MKAGVVKKRKGVIGVSRESLRLLYGDDCYLCGGTMLFESRLHSDPRYATMEHVLPRALGGMTTWENMRLACFECNNDKKDTPLEIYLARKEDSS